MKIRTERSSFGICTNVYADGQFMGNVFQFTRSQFGVAPDNRWYFDRAGCAHSGYETHDEAVIAAAHRFDALSLAEVA